MTTQRDRLAAVLLNMAYPWHDVAVDDPPVMDVGDLTNSGTATPWEMADALLARGVRVDEQAPDGIEREVVECDDKCGALEEPITFDEVRYAYEHWRDHSYLNGCSHGN